MTDKQPEALRLADALMLYKVDAKEEIKAAAELRRLHEVNSELVEALKEAEFALDEYPFTSRRIATAKLLAHTAISKATGEQYAN